MDEMLGLAGRRRTGILTRARVRISLTALKTCLAGEYFAAFLSRVSILSSRSEIWSSTVGVVILDVQCETL